MNPFGKLTIKAIQVAGIGFMLAANSDFGLAQSPDTWSLRQPPTYVNRSASIAVNGKIYVFGSDASGRAASNSVYDPATDQWTALAPMPTIVTSPATAAVGGLIYVLGGYNPASGTVYIPSPNQVYNPSTNSWSTAASPNVARAFATAQAIGTKIYLIGGYPGGNSVLADTEQFDPATDTWTTMTSMPTARAATASVAIGNTIYVIGGLIGVFGGQNVGGTTEAYDASNNVWSTKATMPTARSEFGAALLDGKIYAFGGVTSPAYISTNEEYDPSSDTWATRAPIPVTMGGNTGAAVNGFAYSMGINRTEGSAQVNYAYTPVTSTLKVQLTVTLAGGGSGTVTSSPAGISCGTAMNQCFASFANGTTVTLTATPAPGSNFLAWAGCDTVAGLNCTLTLSSHRGVFATFTTSVPLTVTRKGNGAGTVTSTPIGINCGPAINQCLSTFPPGTRVTLIAAAAVGSVFGGWSGCDQVVGLNCSVLLSAAPRSVIATFLKLISLTVVRNGTGAGTVTSNPAGINCGSAANQCTAVFPSSSQTTLSATPAPGSNFGGWSGCDSVAGSTCTIVFGSSARIATVTFAKGPAVFDLISVIRTGTGTGSITSNPPGISCAPTSGNPCSGTFVRGTQVTLTATPTIFSDFGGWFECGKASGLSCTFTVTSARTISVLFNGGTPVSRSLQVSVIGPGSGTVTSNPGGISCPFTCFATFDPIQQTIVLTAIPSGGSSFDGWNGCDSVAGTNCVVLLSNMTKLVTAKFTRLAASVQLQVTRSGTGTGSVTSNPPGLSCAPTSGNPCSGTFTAGTQVTLTATPTIFSDFGGWFGCNKVSGLNCTVDLRNAQTVSVLFNGGTPVSRSLQVSVIGPGGGTVTSNPGGITCPFTCLATFDPIQQTIFLTAFPAARSTFSGWSGCDSAAGTNCEVLLSNVTRIVTARFN